MNKYPRNWNIKQICTMIDKGTITFDNPLQRPSGQWKDEDKSLFIDSILTLFVPDIYAIQVKKDGGNVYDIIDGKQRLTTIYTFLNNEWTLTNLEPVKLESTNEVYDISNKRFSDLPEVVQNEINGYNINIKAFELEDGEDEEAVVEDIFYRLNNGKAVSREHLAFISTDSNVRDFVRCIVDESNLYNKVAHFPPGAVRKSDKHMSVMQSIILVSGLDFKSFIAKTGVERFFVENEVSNEVLKRTEYLFNVLADVFDNEKNKFVNKTHISALIAFLNEVEDIESAKEFILWYSKNIKRGDLFKQYCGAGSTKKENVFGRVRALNELYKKYMEEVKGKKVA